MLQFVAVCREYVVSCQSLHICSNPVVLRILSFVNLTLGVLPAWRVSGLENADSHCGIYAADAECYEKFEDVFMPIIADYHKVNL